MTTSSIGQESPSSLTLERERVSLNIIWSITTFLIDLLSAADIHSCVPRECRVNQRFSFRWVSVLTFGVILVARIGYAADVVEAFTEPYRTAVMVPSQPGLMESIRVKVGQRVTAGQDLGALDSDVLRVQRRICLAKSEASSELEAAKAELEVRKSLYERYLALRKDSNEASELEVNRKRADMEIQQAKVRSVEEARSLQLLEVEQLDAQLRQRMFVSPIDGFVVDVEVEQGDFVAPGQTKSLITIVDIDRLRATFHVPSREAASLATDQEIMLAIPDSAMSVPARVEYVSPITDPRTGTVVVRAILPNEKHTIRSGIRCRLQPRTTQNTSQAAAKPATPPAK